MAFAPSRPLFSRAVELAHRAIDADLVERVEPDDRFGEVFVDVPDRGLDAFAAVARGVVVTQLDRLVRAGRCAGRHTGDAAVAAEQRDLDLQRGIAARIENLPAPHRFDRRIHPRFLPARISAVRGTSASTEPHRREYRTGIRSRTSATAILRHDIERDGDDGDEYPLARQTGTAVATENRRGGAAEKFPPEPDGERAKRAA